MVHSRRRRSAAWSVVGFWVFWGMMLGQPCGELRAAPSLSNLAPPLPFRLTVHKGVLSLHAQDASLKEILVFPKSAGTTGLDVPTGEEDVRAGESPLTPQRRTRQEPTYQEVPRPQPFKFEFDPSQAVEERK